MKKRGFDVLDIGQDLTREQMAAELDTFYSRIKPGTAALVYFSGYGIQGGNGHSYLMPVNAQVWSDADVRHDGVDVQGVLDEMNIRGAALKIAIIDASRRTPWERRYRAASMGLAPVVGNKGSIVIYAAAPNTVVDDEEGENSLFMRTLLKGIQAPGLTVEQAFFKTRNEVSQASKGEQVPWVSSFVMGDVYINPPAQGAQTAQPQSPRQPTPDPCAAAEAHWKSAEALGSRMAYADHLARFADCPFATLAQARIEMIDQAAAQKAAEEAARKAAEQKAAEQKAADQKAAEQKAALAAKEAEQKAAEPKLAPSAPAPGPSTAGTQLASADRPATSSSSSPSGTACAVRPAGRSPALAMGGQFAPVSISPDFNAAKPVRAVEFSPDGSKFATAGDDGAIRVWDVSNFRLLATLRADQDPVYGLSFWSDGALLASASATGTIRVWDLRNGRVVNTFRAGSDSGRALRQFGVAFAPDRTLQYVDSVGDDGRVWIWDVQQNALRKTRQNLPVKSAGDPTVRSISFAPDMSGHFATASFDGAIRFYTGAGEPETYPVYSGKALRVAYSPDGRRVVSAGVDRALRNLKLWDAKTHTVIRNLEGHTDYVISAAWSADGTRIVSGGGGRDRAVRVWDVARGTQLQTLVGHREDVEAVAFFPGRDWVVSVSEDKTLKLWDVSSGRELMSIVAFGDGEYVAYTPFGCYAGSPGAEQHFKVVIEGVARDLTQDTRKALNVAGGIGPLLAATER